MNKLIIFTDGGARGNPGPAGVGVVIKDEKSNLIHQFGKRIGETTNNVAEYTAVVEALKWVRGWVVGQPTTNNSPVIHFFLDSKLVVNQINGLYKIKDPHLRELLMEIHELEAEIGVKIYYQLIPREQNQLADKMVNKSLDMAI